MSTIDQVVAAHEAFASAISDYETTSNGFKFKGMSFALEEAQEDTDGQKKEGLLARLRALLTRFISWMKSFFSKERAETKARDDKVKEKYEKKKAEGFYEAVELIVKRAETDPAAHAYLEKVNEYVKDNKAFVTKAGTNTLRDYRFIPGCFNDAAELRLLVSNAMDVMADLRNFDKVNTTAANNAANNLIESCKKFKEPCSLEELLKALQGGWKPNHEYEKAIEGVDGMHRTMIDQLEKLKEIKSEDVTPEKMKLVHTLIDALAMFIPISKNWKNGFVKIGKWDGLYSALNEVKEYSDDTTSLVIETIFRGVEIKLPPKPTASAEKKEDKKDDAK